MTGVWCSVFTRLKHYHVLEQRRKIVTMGEVLLKSILQQTAHRFGEQKLLASYYILNVCIAVIKFYMAQFYPYAYKLAPQRRTCRLSGWL